MFLGVKSVTSSVVDEFACFIEVGLELFIGGAVIRRALGVGFFAEAED